MTIVLPFLFISISEANPISEPAVAHIKEDEATIEWSGDELTFLTIDYGLTEKLGHKKDSFDFAKEHSLTLKNLKPNHFYFYKIKTRNKADKTQDSSIYSFQTEASEKQSQGILKMISPPQITPVSPSEIIISWETNHSSFGLITYGLQGQKPNHYATHVDTKIHIISLKDLIPNTRYFYQVESKNLLGKKVTSSYASFITPSADKKSLLPYIVFGPAVAIRAADELKIEWTTDRPCQSTVSFGKTPFPSFQTKKVASSQFIKNHVFRLTKLKKKNRYFYTIYLIDQNGQKSTSEIYSVTTENFD